MTAEHFASTNFIFVTIEQKNYKICRNIILVQESNILIVGLESSPPPLVIIRIKLNVLFVKRKYRSAIKYSISRNKNLVFPLFDNVGFAKVVK